MRIKYINPQGLPEHYARAVKLLEAQYDKGECDYSVTELCSPPRIRALKRRDVEIEVDVADRSHSIAGTAMHAILEVLRQDPDYLIEKRLFKEFEGVVISGQLDGFFYPENELFDWKGTRWPTYSDGVKVEYVAQLNICRWLLMGGKDADGREYSHQAAKLTSTAMFRDYSKITAPFKAPHLPVDGFPVPIWSDEFLHDFIRTRIALMRQAEQTLPLCTDAEVWATHDKWAVEPIKPGRARKLCYSEAEAEAWRLKHKQPNTLVTVFRPSTRPRCRHFCDVNSICDVWINHPANPDNQTDHKNQSED